MKQLILFFLIGFLPLSSLAAIELERISPTNNFNAKSNKSIKFSVRANDSKGLAYSKWQLSGKLMDRHILTGSSKFDEWYYSFNRTGTFFVSVAVYNIDGNSKMIIWKINVEGDKQSVPTIVAVNPSGSYISVDEGQEEVFKIDISDEDCQLDRIEWLVDGEIKGSNSLDGCSKREKFSYSFYSARDYEVCANVFNSRGSKESKCWNVDVSRKSSNYTAGNNNSNTSQSTPNYSSNLTPKSKRKSFIGVSYSTRTMLDDRTTIFGDNLQDVLDDTPSMFELFGRGSTGVLGSQFGFWTMNCGDLSQVGFRLELLLFLRIGNDDFSVNFYGGGGGVYQSTTAKIDYKDYESKSFGYSYSSGVEIQIGKKFLIFAEYNAISASSGFGFKQERYIGSDYNYDYYQSDSIENVNVGSYGFSFGLAYGL